MKQILILLTLSTFFGCTKNYYNEQTVQQSIESRSIEGKIDQKLVTQQPTFMLTFTIDNKIKVHLINPPINYGNPDEFIWINRWYVSRTLTSGSKVYNNEKEVSVNKGAGFLVTVQAINQLTGIKSQEITTGLFFK